MSESLGDRMKEYEAVTNHHLPKMTPVIIRIDGVHFHTFTKAFEKPFDDLFIKVMQRTCKSLCERVQNCQFGYVESDEISLLLYPKSLIDAGYWFDNKIEKICSVTASMAAMYFNKYLVEELNNEPDSELHQKHLKALGKEAYFDARCFSLPKEDVTNYFIWRQNDATRNSIQGLGQSVFSQKELSGKNNNIVQCMLLEQKDINWNNYPVVKKRGSACFRQNVTKQFNDKLYDTLSFEIDENMPIIKDNRDYIENCLKTID